MADEEEQIVWQNTVDGGVWGCKVFRTFPEGMQEGYHGRLEVWNIETGETILSEDVGLSYQALFGPDVSDLAQWQDKVIAAIDAVMKAKET